MSRERALGGRTLHTAICIINAQHFEFSIGNDEIMQKMPLKSVIFMRKVPFILHIAVTGGGVAPSRGFLHTSSLDIDRCAPLSLLAAQSSLYWVPDLDIRRPPVLASPANQVVRGAVCVAIFAEAVPTTRRAAVASYAKFFTVVAPLRPLVGTNSLVLVQLAGPGGAHEVLWRAWTQPEQPILLRRFVIACIFALAAVVAIHSAAGGHRPASHRLHGHTKLEWKWIVMSRRARERGMRAHEAAKGEVAGVGRTQRDV